MDLNIFHNTPKIWLVATDGAISCCVVKMKTEKLWSFENCFRLETLPSDNSFAHNGLLTNEHSFSQYLST